MSIQTHLTYCFLAKRAYIDNINNPTAKIRPYTGAVEFTACKYW